MKPMKDLYNKNPNDLEKVIEELKVKNKRLEESVADLKKKLEFVVQEYRNKGTL